MLHQILQQAFADGTRCIDRLGTDDPYKLEVERRCPRARRVDMAASDPSRHRRVPVAQLWRASRNRGQNLMRERLPEPVIERMKAVKVGVAGLRTQR